MLLLRACLLAVDGRHARPRTVRRLCGAHTVASKLHACLQRGRHSLRLAVPELVPAPDVADGPAIADLGSEGGRPGDNPTTQRPGGISLAHMRAYLCGFHIMPPAPLCYTM